MRKIIIQIFMAIVFAMPVIGQSLQIQDVTGAVPGPVTVNVNMTGFADVGAVYLLIDYDGDLLTYTGPSSVIFLGGTISIGANYGGSSVMALSWFNSAGTPINGTFIGLQFSYSGGFSSDLTFLVDDCEITTSSGGPIIPTPTFDNGSITPLAGVDGYLGIESPLPNSTDVGSPVSLAMQIWGNPAFLSFQTINSLTLFVAFDPAKLNYTGVSNNGYGFTYGIESAGLLKLQWSNTTPEDFSDLTDLLNLDFVYQGGGTAMIEFQEGSIVTSGIDELNVFYYDGSIIPNPNLPQKAIIGDVYVCEDQYVSVPVSFELMPTVGAFDFKIGFDPDVVNYDALTDYHANITSIAVSLNPAGDELTISWFNASGKDLNGQLFKILFEYKFDTAFVYPPPVPDFNSSVIFKGGSVVKTTSAVPIPASYINGSITHARQLNFNVYLEGLYSGGGIMRQAWNTTGPQFPTGVADQLTVELHDAGNYANVIWSQSEVNLNTDGSASVQIPYEFDGDYYLTIINRNHLETVSMQHSGAFTDCSMEYDFTTAANKAFGSNQKDLGDGKFAIFAGDVYPAGATDGVIDLFDVLEISAGVREGQDGYVPLDVNGDGVVDLFDILDIIGNVRNGVSAIIP